MEQPNFFEAEIRLAISVTKTLAGFGTKLAIELADKLARKHVTRHDDHTKYIKFCNIFAASLIRINLSISSMERHDWEELKCIRKLLKDLEKICTWGKNRPAVIHCQQTVPSSVADIYPTLFAISEGSETSITSLRSFAGSTKPRMKDQRKRLLDMLDLFASQTEEICPDEAISEPRPEHNLMDKDINDYTHQIKELYEIVLKHRLCSCEKGSQFPMDVNLALNGCDPSSDFDGGAVFRVFFLGHSNPRTLVKERWQETRIHIKRRRKVRVSSTQVESDSASIFIKDGFCQVINQGDHLPLLFTVSKDTISFKGPITETRFWLRHLQSVSIKEVLTKSKLSKKMRLRLSCVVAKAVWLYYDSEWMLRDWSRENINFMLERDGYYGQPCLFADEPFLNANFDSQPLDSTAEDQIAMQHRIHKYPKILALVILLIEIELGGPIEKHWLPAFLGEDRQPNINTYYCTAAHLLYSRDQQRKWDEQETFSEYKSIIRTCLDQNVFNMGQNDVSSQRMALLKHVVCPLDALFQKAWTGGEAKILPLPYGETLRDTHVASTPICVPERPSVENGTMMSEMLGFSGNMCKICPRSRTDFTIAIICALTVEAEAVEDLFDETYDRLGKFYGRQLGDTNAYINGRIGNHNVVLCYMPEMGKRSAASVASNLRVSYTKIQVALIVGICGGAPHLSPNEQIFLGDIIISDAVIEYDFGKQYPGGFKRRTDVKNILGRPSQEIRALLAGLKTRRSRISFRNQVSQYVRIIQQSNAQWQHPGLDDVLFRSSYHHKHYVQGSSAKCLCFDGNSPDDVCNEVLEKICCDIGCDENQIIRRRQYEGMDNASVHIGTIASADTVMKSGEHRDRLIKTEQVIGFEMEGAGVWENISCIIIKGVCDYADSHKDKSWQAYAAATGASAAKTFLEYWRPLVR